MRLGRSKPAPPLRHHSWHRAGRLDARPGHCADGCRWNTRIRLCGDLRHPRGRHARAIRPAAQVRCRRSVQIRAQSDVHRRFHRAFRLRLVTNSRPQFCSSLYRGFYPLISLSSCTKNRISAPRLALNMMCIAVRCAAGCPAAYPCRNSEFL